MTNQKVEPGAYEHHELSNEGTTKLVRKDGNESNGVLESTIFDPIMLYWCDVTTF
jgi:hypothetical protein